MTRAYGNRWSSIAESDDGTWLNALRGLTPEQVGNGYRKMIDCGRYDWPPSAPEFRKLCVDIDEVALARYIRQIAFKGYDSYYINQMTQKDQDFHIRQVRAKATADFYQMAIEFTAAEAQLALEDQS